MSHSHQIDITELSILLVEPSKTQSKVITNHLTSEGVANIETAINGKEVFQSLSNHLPDLIISSLYLPDMTATEMVESIKKSSHTKDIPVMLISSETKFNALDPIRQAGVIAILPKPFNHEDIERALHTTLDYLDPDEISLKNYNIEDIRVLLVDDSLMARKHVARVLHNIGIREITEARDGKEGIEIFEQSDESFDLIVTDYNMPVMDGEELIHYIRSELDNPFIPILMVTSEDNETQLNNVHQAGVSAICDKPFEPETIKQLLFKVLDDA